MSDRGVSSVTGTTVVPATNESSATAWEPAGVVLTRHGSVGSSAAFIWNGRGGDDNWTTGGNWSGGTAPDAANADVTFGGAARLTPNLNTSYSVHSVSFAASAGAFNLAGSNTLTVGNGGITQNSPNPQTISVSNLVPGAPQTWNVAGAGGLMINSALTGNADLIKTGMGTLTLNAANTFSGGMQINSGTVTLGNSLALQNSTVVLPNINNGNNGVSALNFGTLTSATLGGISSSGLAYLNLSNNAATPAAVALTVGNNNADTLFVSDIRGSGSLIKIGSGTLSLPGSPTFGNDYKGGTTISGGTLAASYGVLGDSLSCNVSVGSVGTLAVGEAANRTNTSLATNTLYLTGLTVAASTARPELTFNLGASGISDSIQYYILSGDNPNLIPISSSGSFDIGFASATGASLSAGTYNLIRFTNTGRVSDLPSLSYYHAVPTGNLTDINTPANPFSYVVVNGAETLQFQITSADASSALPEPSALAFFLGSPAIGLYRAILKRGKANKPLI